MDRCSSGVFTLSSFRSARRWLVSVVSFSRSKISASEALLGVLWVILDDSSMMFKMGSAQVALEGSHACRMRQCKSRWRRQDKQILWLGLGESTQDSVAIQVYAFSKWIDSKKGEMKPIQKPNSRQKPRTPDASLGANG